MELFKIDELITHFQMEMMCKHLDNEDIHRVLNSFMNKIDAFIQSNGWTIKKSSNHYREIVKSKLFCLMERIRVGDTKDITDDLDDVNDSIETYVDSCVFQSNDLYKHSMMSNLFI
jgi:hypothetical protein